MPSQVREVRVIAKTSGSKELKDLSRQFASTNKNVAVLSKGFSGLKNVFSGFLATLGLREIASASDQFQLFNDRIKAFVGDSEIAKNVFEDIVDVARRTKTSVSALGDIYNRVALSTKDLGLTNEQVIDTVEVLQNTFRIAGSSIAEATGATVQLTQGLSAGALRGQELRSVLEANAVLADILAKQFNISRGQLIKFAETGKITAEKVLTALANNADEVNKKAEQLSQTFEQSTIIALDAFRKKIFELNRDFDVSGKFAKGIEFLIRNLDDLFRLIGSFVAAGTLVVLAKQLSNINTILKGSALLTLVTPTKAAVAAIAGLVFVVSKLQDKIDESNTKSGIEKRLAGLRKELSALQKEDEKIRQNGQSFFERFVNPFTKNKEEVSQAIKLTRREIEKLEMQLSKFNKEGTGRGKGLEVFKQNAKESEVSLKTLNLQFASGLLTVKQYNAELLKLEKAKLNEQFENGTISLIDFERKLGLIERRMRALNSLSGGVFDGFSLGVQQYVADIDVVKQGADTIKNSFNSLNDTFFTSIKNSKDAEGAFKAFVQGVLDDLLKLAIRLTITNQIAVALNRTLSGNSTATPSSSFDFTSTGANSVNVSEVAYNGKVFNRGNVVPHYNGGVISQMSAFPMSGGRVGTIAEKGPEAIMPLERTSDGKLGVKSTQPQTVINVINNTPADVQTRETQGPGGQRQIEILVNETVKRGVASGAFDKSFNGRYNLKPRGK